MRALARSERLQGVNMENTKYKFFKDAVGKAKKKKEEKPSQDDSSAAKEARRKSRELKKKQGKW